MNHHSRKVKPDLRPKGLQGISEDQIAQHWTLYEGYVKNANLLKDKLSALAQKGDFGPEFAELKRRLGYELNGIVLHEHYFGGLKAGRKVLGEESELKKNLKRSFGGFEAWKREFTAMGSMRGVGWVILYFDPQERMLSNHWIELHQDGHPSGFVPILVMDVWEHAYMVDRGAGGRAAYVEAFLKNVDWDQAERGLHAALRLAEAEALAV